MNKNQRVFCIEGFNKNIGKLMWKLNTDQIKQLKMLCKEAEELTGINVLKIQALELEDKNINRIFSELVITYICDYIVYNTYLCNGIKPAVIVGYSMGLNTALVCGGYLTFAGGIEILKSVKKCIEYSSQKLNREMIIIIGLTKKTVGEIIDINGWKKYLTIGSENSKYCILVTGEHEYIHKLLNEADGEGAFKTIVLNTPISFHFGKREEWMEECISNIDKLIITPGRIKIMSVYSLDFLRVESIKEELKKNVYTPMNWRGVIERLENKGFIDFWDISIDGSIKKLSTLNNEKAFFNTFRSVKALLK